MADAPCCSICTEPLAEGGSHALACGHAFHAACICEWFRRGASSCPNCRDAPAFGPPSSLNVWARAKFLRRSARSARAPPPLKRAVERLRKAEDKAKAAASALRDFEKTHRTVLKAHRRLQRRRWDSRGLKMSRERELGVYDSAEFPVPLLLREVPVRFALGDASDDE